MTTIEDVLRDRNQQERAERAAAIRAERANHQTIVAELRVQIDEAMAAATARLAATNPAYAGGELRTIEYPLGSTQQVGAWFLHYDHRYSMYFCPTLGIIATKHPQHWNIARINCLAEMTDTYIADGVAGEIGTLRTILQRLHQLGLSA